ncbi:KH domain-containing protein [Candidatus Berkelbacteria bacterium]|nr:KH domain-containing protein [Candidatus Berkelbacteria bacterium]
MTDYQDTAFVEYVIKQLVENQDAVQVERTVDEMGVLIKLTVDPKDMGRVIGKEGRTAKAVRTLLRVLGAKNNARVNLKIMEPGGGEYVADSDAGDDRPRRSHRDESDEKAPAAEQPIEEVPAVTEEQAAPEPQPASDDEQATEVL